MKRLLPILLILISCHLSAQEYTTPNTGVNWTLGDLYTESPESVDFEEGVYTLKQEIEVASNDTLRFLPGQTLLLDPEVRMIISGKLLSLGTEEEMVMINATDSLSPYKGFRLENESVVKIDYTSIKNGGGIQAITPDFEITNSVLSYNTTGGVNTGTTINVSNGSPLIANNVFYKNALSAVASGANSDVAARILDNYIEANTQSNQNRPQINMGATGSDTLQIIGNTIIGDREITKAGGISVANLIGGQLNALIENNTIQDNRYGINVQGAGNAQVYIIGNIIEDNDTEGNPAVGGSGISTYSASDTQFTYVRDNEIRRNLWGITIIEQATTHLGDEDNPGNNVFSENGNGGITYALYNNTPNTIWAQYNCWIEGAESTLEEAGEVIFDQADDDSLGEVIYDPINCGVMSVPNLSKMDFRIYPNPATESIHFINEFDFAQAVILSFDGKVVHKATLQNGENSLSFDLATGIYWVQFVGEQGKLTKKLIIK